MLIWDKIWLLSSQHTHTRVFTHTWVHISSCQFLFEIYGVCTADVCAAGKHILRHIQLPHNRHRPCLPLYPAVGLLKAKCIVSQQQETTRTPTGRHSGRRRSPSFSLAAWCYPFAWSTICSTNCAWSYAHCPLRLLPWMYACVCWKLNIMSSA